MARRSPRPRRAAPRALALALLACALAPSAAAAAPAPAPGTLPAGFWGVNWDNEISFHSAPDEREANWQTMADSGVQSARATFLWSSAQRYWNSSYDYTATDAMVKLAVEHGISLLPVVAGAPRWARESDAQNAPPKKKDWYTYYLYALIGRYGKTGTFWTDNPTLPKRPIRAFQVWNEPSARYQWTIKKGRDWAPGYGKLLRMSYDAVKAVDPDTRIVMAGLPNHSSEDLQHLYDKGDVHGYFDAAALHPYTAEKHGVLTLARRFRKVMKKNGDGGKQLWITELGLPASKGKSNDKSKLQTDDQGMAKFLSQSYRDLAANRHELRVPKVYWYTWASPYHGWIFNYTGLRLYTHDGGHVKQSNMPAFAVYRKLALRAEGR